MQGRTSALSLPATCNVAGLGGAAQTEAFSIFATPNTLSLEGVSQGGSSSAASGAATLTMGLPADSSAALTMFDLGGIFHRVLSCFATPGSSVDNGLKKLTDLSGIDLDADVLSWLHGEAVAVVGPSPGAGKAPAYGLLVAPSDQAKAVAALVKLRTTLADQGVGLKQQSIGGANAYVFDRPVGTGVQP